MKHTPGPWKAETVHGHEGNLVYCRITSPNYEHPGGMAYTTIPLKGKTKKQKELAGLYASQGQQLAQWNAKLIAAAPDMLKALDRYETNMHELIQHYTNESESFDEGSDERRMYLRNLADAKDDLKKIKEVIKKATE